MDHYRFEDDAVADPLVEDFGPVLLYETQEEGNHLQLRTELTVGKKISSGESHAKWSSCREEGEEGSRLQL